LLILLTSILDVVLVTLSIAFIGPRGIENEYFIFYFPIFFAFALVFPPRATVGYTLLALTAFFAANFVSDPAFLISSADLKQFVMRVITLSAMSGLGTYYYRAQRDRRRVAISKRRAAVTPVSATVQEAAA
jgi:hypothetical protein